MGWRQDGRWSPLVGGVSFIDRLDVGVPLNGRHRGVLTISADWVIMDGDILTCRLLTVTFKAIGHVA